MNVKSQHLLPFAQASPPLAAPQENCIYLFNIPPQDSFPTDLVALSKVNHASQFPLNLIMPPLAPGLGEHDLGEEGVRRFKLLNYLRFKFKLQMVVQAISATSGSESKGKKKHADARS